MKDKFYTVFNENFYLVYGIDDGWLVYTNEKHAKADYKALSQTEDTARFLKVGEFQELSKEE